MIWVRFSLYNCAADADETSCLAWRERGRSDSCAQNFLTARGKSAENVDLRRDAKQFRARRARRGARPSF